MTVGTLVLIPVIFDTTEKLFDLVKNGPEGKNVFLAKNNYVKIGINMKKKELTSNPIFIFRSIPTF